MVTTGPQPSAGVVHSLVPARLDRLRWTPFHTRLVVALGVAWVLDGLEITVASAVAGVLSQPNTLHLSSTAVGAVASVYLAGEVVGALVFGRLSDRLGGGTVHGDTRGVHVGSGLTALTSAAAPAGYLPLCHAFHRWYGHWRGVCGDQLRNR